MFALTLRHPWPWAIIHLGKRIENRRWQAAMALGTWYAIHGGKSPTRQDELQQILGDCRAWTGNGRLTLDDVIRPGIVALAQHGGYVKTSDEPWFTGPIGWVISDLIVLPEPIPCRGAQGLWTVPDEIEKRLRKELDKCRN